MWLALSVLIGWHYSNPLASVIFVSFSGYHEGFIFTLGIIAVPCCTWELLVLSWFCQATPFGKMISIFFYFFPYFWILALPHCFPSSLLWGLHSLGYYCSLPTFLFYALPSHLFVVCSSFPCFLVSLLCSTLHALFFLLTIFSLILPSFLSSTLFLPEKFSLGGAFLLYVCLFSFFICFKILNAWFSIFNSNGNVSLKPFSASRLVFNGGIFFSRFACKFTSWFWEL